MASAAIDIRDRQVGHLLQVLERRVGLEDLTERLRARGTDAVVMEAAKEGRGELSTAIDSMGEGMEQRT